MRLHPLRAAVLTAACATTLAIPPAAVARHDDRAAPASAQAAQNWNANAVEAVRAVLPPPTPSRFQTEGIIYMSYVQAAVYDAVTKIEGRYVPYHDFRVDPGLLGDPRGRFLARRTPPSTEAAVIAAAYNTLVAYVGDSGGTLAAKYAADVAALPERGKAAGIAIGQAASADLVALRADDGRNAPTAVFGTAGPVTAGMWQVVPPALTAQTPWVAFMRPFMLESGDQFRADPPPDLTSAEYTRDFNEVKAYGALHSAVRTPEQTATAYFWNANVINQYNDVLRRVATDHGFDLVDTVRLLAMGNMVTADAGITCFDSKYHYLFWRPYTAIRNAGLDGNPATEPDPQWAALLNTPNHPEYPSAHGCATGAFARVLGRALHTRNINVDVQGATNGTATLDTTRHYDTVADITGEMPDARVWMGFHFRGSVLAGLDVARDVTRWTLARYFRPADGGADEEGG